jgi:hypothetical protein
MKLRTVAVLLLVAMLVVPTPAAAVTRGEPDLSLVLSDNRVTAGESTTLTVSVVNSGEADLVEQTIPTERNIVTTARGTTLEMSAGDAPIEVLTNEVAVGSVGTQAPVPARFDISVDEDAKPGTYDVPVEVSYAYTNQIAGDPPNRVQSEETVTETIDVTIRVTEQATFEVVSAETDAPVGATGEVTVSVENTGNEAASDASFALQSKNSDLTFGGSPTAESYVGEWEAGEVREFTFAARVGGDAERRPLALAGTISYEDADGVPQQESLSLGVVPAAEQTFTARTVSTTAAPGDTGRLTVELTNTADRTLRDASVSLQSPNAGLTFGGSPSASSFVGEWGPGESREVTVESTFAPSAEDRSFTVDATVSYTGADGRTARADPVTVSVLPAAEQTFSAEVTSVTASTGDSGRLTLSLTNTGERAVSDATVSVQSTNAGLTFGGSPSATSFVGEWAPGESREVTVEASFAGTAEERSYTVDTTVAYEDVDGTDAQSAPVRVGVTPAAEQSFSLASTDATLRVGEEGTLTGEVVNDGPGEIENAVLVLQPVSSNVDTPETEYAVGDLAPGESVAFEYAVEVSSEARDGPRQFTYRLQYDDADGEARQSDPLYARHGIGPQRQVFDVDSNVSVQAGSSTTMELTVTNNDEQELTDVTAKIFADSPITVDDDEAFVDSIPPGESRTLLFSISAAGSATAKDYPVSMDFQYTEPDGDTKLSDTYQIPVSVTASEGGGILSTVPLGVGGLGVGAAVLLLGGVAFAVRGRRP